jgi:hypothetical protein
VTVYALKADGSKGAQLGTGSTDANGAYSISIGSYSGPVVVEAYGGYTDEATGKPMTVPVTAPLRAALPTASGSVSLSVTPLTDLAVRQAGTLTAANIGTANTLITNLFKVPEITSTAPTQKDYALTLGAVSQLMQTGGGTLEATLAILNSGISPAGMSAGTVADIKAATTTFIASPNNKTGVTSIADTSLQNIGSSATSMKLTLVLQGSGAASVRGIQATITLPTGVVLRADANGATSSGVVTAAASAPSGYIESKYTAASATVTLGFITDKSMVAGELLTLTADLSAGVSASAAVAFTLSAVKLIDADGKVVSGASLLLQ